MNEPLLMTPEIASTAPGVKTAMQIDLFATKSNFSTSQSTFKVRFTPTGSS